MKQEPWERVVAALLRLGCVTLADREFSVTVCRGAAVLARVRKLSPVPVRAQRDLLATLSFDEAEYLAALAAL